MKLQKIVKLATDKGNFTDLNGYYKFCLIYLEYISANIQAVIVSQNENHYNFYQYGKEGNYQITRPVNSSLMYNIESFSKVGKEFIKLLKGSKDIRASNSEQRKILLNSVYTIQQSIGAALDGLPAGKSNTARKLNGDLFENFIRLIIKEIGVDCRAGVVQVPVVVDGESLFNMSYQHDLIVEDADKIKLIGSIKTSSKDRIDKIFIDKFLYTKLTETLIPHVAVFLNDVQRKNTSKENEYGINSTFLPGHFKGYTVKLNPLDGVYYCDIRPNMKTETILKDHIKTFDHLICDDIWKFL
jgi:hypothetical protein